MPQLHCYVPKDVAERFRLQAESQGTSVSALLGALVRREAGVDDWPDGWFDAVAGSWQGDPLERPLQPSANEREALA